MELQIDAVGKMKVATRVLDHRNFFLNWRPLLESDLQCRHTLHGVCSSVVLEATNKPVLRAVDGHFVSSKSPYMFPNKDKSSCWRKQKRIVFPVWGVIYSSSQQVKDFLPIWPTPYLIACSLILGIQEPWNNAKLQDMAGLCTPSPPPPPKLTLQTMSESLNLPGIFFHHIPHLTVIFCSRRVWPRYFYGGERIFEIYPSTFWLGV